MREIFWNSVFMGQSFLRLIWFHSIQLRPLGYIEVSEGANDLQFGTNKMDN
jgi:hypothetical protein